MDKSLEARRVFSATNTRILEAINAASESGETELLQQIQFVMTVSAYERLLDSGMYKSVKRKKSDRRSSDRRTGDRRNPGHR